MSGWKLAFVAVFAGVLFGGLPTQAGELLVIDGGMLIDPGHPELTGVATLVVEDGVIRSVDPGAQVEWGEGTRVIDARGRYVMPGLADMHNHLRSGLFRPGNDTPAILRELLQWGVTTTFDPGVREEEFGPLREQIDASPTAFPRTFLVRGVFTTDGGWGHGYKPATAEEARAIVRDLRAAGSDGVKLMYDDMRWATTRPFAVMDREIAAAIIDEAHRQDMLAFVHAPILELATQALEDGADCLIHGVLSDPVDTAFLDLMKRNGACYISTLVMFETNAGYGPWADRLEAFDLEHRLDAKAMDLFRRVPNVCWSRNPIFLRLKTGISGA